MLYPFSLFLNLLKTFNVAHLYYAYSKPFLFLLQFVILRFKRWLDGMRINFLIKILGVLFEAVFSKSVFCSSWQVMDISTFEEVKVRVMFFRNKRFYQSYCRKLLGTCCCRSFRLYCCTSELLKNLLNHSDLKPLIFITTCFSVIHFCNSLNNNLNPKLTKIIESSIYYEDIIAHLLNLWHYFTANGPVFKSSVNVS